MRITEFDNLIDSLLFFLFEEGQQPRAIENKRIKRKKNSAEYVMLASYSVDRSILSSLHIFRYLTANKMKKKKKYSICMYIYINNFTRGQKKFENLLSERLLIEEERKI